MLTGRTGCRTILGSFGPLPACVLSRSGTSRTSSADRFRSGSTHARSWRGNAPDRVQRCWAVRQPVDCLQAGGQAQTLLGQDRFPQRGLRVYGSQHDGLNPFHTKGLRPSSRHSGCITSTHDTQNRRSKRWSSPTFSGASRYVSVPALAIGQAVQIVLAAHDVLVATP